MSFERLRMLMCEPYNPEKDAEYIEAIEAIDNEQERLLACEYFTSHGFLIQTVQRKIPKLPIYHKLFLWKHNLTSLEGVVFPQRLEWLSLSQNNLTSIEGIVFPPSLQELSLWGNNIRSLEDVVFSGGLQWLDLSYNNLTSLEGVVFPTSLQWLDLSNNNITSLEGVVFPQGLQWLRLSQNNLTSLEIEQIKKRLPNTIIDA